MPSSLSGELRTTQDLSVNPEDRVWLRQVNGLAAQLGTSAFGHAGLPNPHKASRVLLFAQHAQKLWPELGDIAVVQTRGFDEIDPECRFWRRGREQFLRILKAHFNAINTKTTAEHIRRMLLADLGFDLIDDFVTSAEEASLLDVWRPNGPVFRQGSNEHHTNRRFFHYGPILPRQSFGTTRSTLNVIPGQLGAMPDVVEGMGLRGRIGVASAGLEDPDSEFDQLYVNWYSALAKGRIGFHHDCAGVLRGVVAGISLSSACDFHLMALDAELCSQPVLQLRLPARSLYMMSGLSRYHLQHGIPSHKADRLSLTFRSVNKAWGGGRKQWAREWSSIPPAEAAKCHWPLLPPAQSAAC